MPCKVGWFDSTIPISLFPSSLFLLPSFFFPLSSSLSPLPDPLSLLLSPLSFIPSPLSPLPFPLSPLLSPLSFLPSSLCVYATILQFHHTATCYLLLSSYLLWKRRGQTRAENSTAAPTLMNKDARFLPYCLVNYRGENVSLFAWISHCNLIFFYVFLALSFSDVHVGWG